MHYRPEGRSLHLWVLRKCYTGATFDAANQTERDSAKEPKAVFSAMFNASADSPNRAFLNFKLRLGPNGSILSRALFVVIVREHMRTKAATRANAAKCRFVRTSASRLIDDRCPVAAAAGQRKGIILQEPKY